MDPLLAYSSAINCRSFGRAIWASQSGLTKFPVLLTSTWIWLRQTQPHREHWGQGAEEPRYGGSWNGPLDFARRLLRMMILTTSYTWLVPVFLKLCMLLRVQLLPQITLLALVLNAKSRSRGDSKFCRHSTNVSGSSSARKDSNAKLLVHFWSCLALSSLLFCKCLSDMQKDTDSVHLLKTDAQIFKEPIDFCMATKAEKYHISVWLLSLRNGVYEEWPGQNALSRAKVHLPQN